MGLGSSLSHFQFTPSAALAILAASIAGSVHCVGMCGGLMLAATGTKLHSQIAYHLFRWLGYLSIGAISGYLGDQLFYDWKWLPLQIFFSTIFLFLLLLAGFSYFFNWKSLVLKNFSNSLSFISKFGMNYGFKVGKTNGSIIRASIVGFFTVFLPCGWLYSFILLSVSTHSIIFGGVTLSVFWLGTLPALMSSRIIIQGVMSKIGVSGTRAISILMITVAFLSVFEHWRHVSIEGTEMGQSNNINCHTNK